MQKTWDHIWVVAEKDHHGRWRKMAKAYSEQFYLSAQDAFDVLNNMNPEIAKSFGVFEIPCLQVFELNSPEEEGKSCRYETPESEDVAPTNENANKEGIVPIKDENIFWQVHAVEDEKISGKSHPATGGPAIQLEWGWTAGMSEEDKKNYASDAPDWSYSVQTTLDMAIILRNQLNTIIARYQGPALDDIDFDELKEWLSSANELYRKKVLAAVARE